MYIFCKIRLLCFWVNAPGSVETSTKDYNSNPSKFIRKTYICIPIIIILSLYNEVYLYYSTDWHSLVCSNNKNCTKILLVADPQLIGLHEEVFHFITPLAIWDSDKYLKKTYKLAIDFVQPDIVIFLGDLFDEGSKATHLEYQYYVERFFDIFHYDPASNVKFIWLPGDNDIGGEAFEKVTADRVQRFDDTFQQPDTIILKNITFYKINRLTQSIPTKLKKADDSNKHVTIGLSHIPLIYIPSIFVDKVLKTLHPQVILSAHEHKSMIVSTDAAMPLDRNVIHLTPENNGIFKYSLGTNYIYELIVPTCSYRMGTKDIGYGYLLLDNDELRYTVLWCPPRFKQLLTYIRFLLIIALYLVYSLINKSICTRSTVLNK